MDRILPLKKSRTELTRLYVLLMLTLYPFFTGFSGYILIDCKKFYTFAGLTAALAVGLLLCRKETDDERACRNNSRWVRLCAVLFLLFSLVSTLLSKTPCFLPWKTQRLDGWLTYALYALCYILVYEYGKADGKLAAAALTVYCAICVTEILQLLGLNPLRLFPNHLNYYDPFVQERAPMLGTFGNIDVTSAYHCLMIPLALSMLSVLRRYYLLLVPAVLGTACVFLAGTAGGELTVSAAWLYAVFRYLYGKRRARRAGLCAFMTFCAAVCVFAALIYLCPPESGSLNEISRVMHGEVLPSFGSHRIEIWDYCFGIFRESPVFGIGPGALVYRTQLSYYRFSEDLGRVVGGVIDNAHNEYLQSLLNFGLAGTVPALAALLIPSADSLKKPGPGREIMLLPAACYLFQAFFNIGLCFVTPLFLIFAGIAPADDPQSADA